jgi:tRNA threonylcarbamoyladenosine biosynthesis protein TsaE
MSEDKHLTESYEIPSKEALSNWCNALAHKLVTGDVVALCGDLGSGKTTAAGFIINSLLSKSINITSPTFNLVQTYPLSDGRKLWHYDLYRLKTLEEVYELGIEDSFATGISLIEWPQIIWNLLPKNTIVVTFEFGCDESARIIRTKYGICK